MAATSYCYSKIVVFTKQILVKLAGKRTWFASAQQILLLGYFGSTCDAIGLNLMAVMFLIILWDLAGFRIDTRVPQRLSLLHNHIFDWMEASPFLMLEASLMVHYCPDDEQ